MKLLGRNNRDGDNDGPGELAEADASPFVEIEPAVGSKQTAPKGRPTPKRDGNVRRGPVAPAPLTMAEARARRKQLRGPKLTKEERRAARAERSARGQQRREKMMSGDEAYLLPRDQGPIRGYARDIVDSRRNVLGLFIPAMLFIMFLTFGFPRLQLFISPAMLLIMMAMAVDAILLARKVRSKVDVKFPSNTESSWKLGTYAAGRASQIRRMRAPRPRVNRGDKVD